MRERTDTLTQGIRGRCGEPLFGLYRWCTGESLNGHSMHRSLLLEKGQLRDAVKSGGTQSTSISMIHRRSLPPGVLSQCVCNNVAVGLWICGRVRIPADRPELKPCGQPMDRAETSAQHASTEPARPTGCPHSRASRPHTHRSCNKLFFRRKKRSIDELQCQSLTGQNISAR
jgi:hypothetical protein